MIYVQQVSLTNLYEHYVWRKYSAVIRQVGTGKNIIMLSYKGCWVNTVRIAYSRISMPRYSNNKQTEIKISIELQPIDKLTDQHDCRSLPHFSSSQFF